MDNGRRGGWKRQQGLSFLEILLLVAVGGFLLMTAIKLVPVYMGYFDVASSVDSLANVAPSQRTVPELRRLLGKRFDINNVNLQPGSVDFTREENGSIDVHVHYTRMTHWVGNVSLLVTFDRRVVVPAG